jgi:hypothetical protein
MQLGNFFQQLARCTDFRAIIQRHDQLYRLAGAAR